jgi:hypothetical protein
MLAGRQGARCVHQLAFADDARRLNWSARSRRKGCTRSSRSTTAASARSISERRAACCSGSRPTLQGFTVDELKETVGNAIKLPPWCESRRAEIVAALAQLR